MKENLSWIAPHQLKPLSIFCILPFIFSKLIAEVFFGFRYAIEMLTWLINWIIEVSCSSLVSPPDV